MKFLFHRFLIIFVACVAGGIVWARKVLELACVAGATNGRKKQRAPARETRVLPRARPFFLEPIYFVAPATQAILEQELQSRAEYEA